MFEFIGLGRLLVQVPKIRFAQQLKEPTTEKLNDSIRVLLGVRFLIRVCSLCASGVITLVVLSSVLMWLSILVLLRKCGSLSMVVPMVLALVSVVMWVLRFIKLPVRM